MSFDPDGSRIATLDWDGTVVLSDVNTGEYYYDLPVGKKGAACNENYNVLVHKTYILMTGRTRNKCRWNPLRPVIAMCYDYCEFSLIDVERKAVEKSNAFQDSRKGLRF